MFKAPKPSKLPHLHLILENLGLPDPQVAHFLDVTPVTLSRWRKNGQAPRPVMLALFWETSWGQSYQQTRLENEAIQAKMESHFLKHRNNRLVKQMLTMEAAQNTQKDGAANGPLYQIG